MEFKWYTRTTSGEKDTELSGAPTYVGAYIIEAVFAGNDNLEAKSIAHNVNIRQAEHEGISKDIIVYRAPVTQSHTYSLEEFLTGVPYGDSLSISYTTILDEGLNGALTGLGGNRIEIKLFAMDLTQENGEIGAFYLELDSQNYSKIPLTLHIKTIPQLEPVNVQVTPARNTLTYGETLGSIALTASAEYNGTPVPGTAVWTAPDTVYPVDNSPITAGWVFTPTDNVTYKAITGSSQITVAKAELTVTVPTVLDLTYNGDEQKLVGQGSAPQSYTMEYSLEQDGGYSSEIPAAANAGTYTVWYRVTGDSNYNDAHGSVKAEIRKDTLTTPSTATLRVYNDWADVYELAFTLPQLSGSRTYGVPVACGVPVVALDNGRCTESATVTENDEGTYTLRLQVNAVSGITGDIGTVKINVATQNYQDFTMTVNVEAFDRTTAAIQLTADKQSMRGRGTVTFKVNRGLIPENAVITVTGADENGSTITAAQNPDGSFKAVLPNRTHTYIFTAAFAGSRMYALASDDVEVSVTHRSSGTTTSGSTGSKDEPATPTPEFDDVPKDSWFREDVEKICDAGLMNGISSSQFGPQLSTTRGMLVTILYRLENEPVVKFDHGFTDVSSSSYYSTAVAWAAKNEIVKGIDAATFASELPVTREQMASMLFRYACYRGMDAVTLAENLSAFTDADRISPYAIPALNWAVGAGLIQGSSNRLGPSAYATRAQLAAVLNRFITAQHISLDK